MALYYLTLSGTAYFSRRATSFPSTRRAYPRVKLGRFFRELRQASATAERCSVLLHSDKPRALLEIRTAMKPATLPRSRKKKGTRWLHHEGIWTKRAIGFPGGCETDVRRLVLTDDYRDLRCVMRGTIPSFRNTIIPSDSVYNTAYLLIKNGPAKVGGVVPSSFASPLPTSQGGQDLSAPPCLSERHASVQFSNQATRS